MLCLHQRNVSVRQQQLLLRCLLASQTASKWADIGNLKRQFDGGNLRGKLQTNGAANYSNKNHQHGNLQNFAQFRVPNPLHWMFLATSGFLVLGTIPR